MKRNQRLLTDLSFSSPVMMGKEKGKTKQKGGIQNVVQVKRPVPYSRFSAAEVTEAMGLPPSEKSQYSNRQYLNHLLWAEFCLFSNSQDLVRHPPLLTSGSSSSKSLSKVCFYFVFLSFPFLSFHLPTRIIFISLSQLSNRALCLYARSLTLLPLFPFQILYSLQQLPMSTSGEKVFFITSGGNRYIQGEGGER